MNHIILCTGRLYREVMFNEVTQNAAGVQEDAMNISSESATQFTPRMTSESMQPTLPEVSGPNISEAPHEFTEANMSESYNDDTLPSPHPSPNVRIDASSPERPNKFSILHHAGMSLCMHLRIAQ